MLRGRLQKFTVKYHSVLNCHNEIQEGPGNPVSK